MQIQHLRLRGSGGGHGRVDDGVGRDERMTEDRDRVVDRPDHEAHLEPEPGTAAASRPPSVTQLRVLRTAAAASPSRWPARNHANARRGATRMASAGRAPRTAQANATAASAGAATSEPAEGRRDRRRLRVGEHDGDRRDRGRRPGAGRKAPGGRAEAAAGSATSPACAATSAASAATNAITCSGAENAGAQRGAVGAGRPAGASRHRRARWSSGARGASPPSSRFVRLRGVAGASCASCRASAPSKALGEEIVHARGGRVVGRALTVRATAPSAGSGR